MSRLRIVHIAPPTTSTNNSTIALPAICQVMVNVSVWQPPDGEEAQDWKFSATYCLLSHAMTQNGARYSSGNFTLASPSTAATPNCSTTITPIATPNAIAVCRPIDASPNPTAAATSTNASARASIRAIDCQAPEVI